MVYLIEAAVICILIMSHSKILFLCSDLRVPLKSLQQYSQLNLRIQFQLMGVYLISKSLVPWDCIFLVLNLNLNDTTFIVQVFHGIQQAP